MAVTSLLLGEGLPKVVGLPEQEDPNNPEHPEIQAIYNRTAIQACSVRAFVPRRTSQPSICIQHVHCLCLPVRAGGRAAAGLNGHLFLLVQGMTAGLMHRWRFWRDACTRWWACCGWAG